MLCDCEFGEHPIICHNEQNMFQTTLGEEENIRPKEYQCYEKPERTQCKNNRWLVIDFTAAFVIQSSVENTRL